MDDLDAESLEELLHAVGQHLEEAGDATVIVVVGGSALAALGWTPRTTRDVDVIARGAGTDTPIRLVPPDPLPEALQAAIRRVARDFGLPQDWMNTEVASQWRFGMPPELDRDIEWRSFGALTVGFAGRQPLIALKLFATVDQGRGSVHFQDLVRLGPTDAELARAAEWVLSQDASDVFPGLVREVVERVRDVVADDRPDG